jgi:hypothetical protein
VPYADAQSARFSLSVSDGQWRVGPQEVLVAVTERASTSVEASGGADRGESMAVVAAEPVDVLGAFTRADDNGLTNTGLGDARALRMFIMRVFREATPASTASAESTAAAPTEAFPRQASPQQPVSLLADILPDRRRTHANTELAGGLDAARISAGDLLALLDVAPDWSGFAVASPGLLMQRIDVGGGARSEAAAGGGDAAQDDGPGLHWDTGTIVRAGGVMVSVGVLFWATRTVGLVASLAFSAPAWRRFDPLPVLHASTPVGGESDTEAQWLDTDISGAMAGLAEDILDHRS